MIVLTHTSRMDTPRASWRNTTHDWTSTVDLDHLEHIRQNTAAYAPGGILHLTLEVVAYVADEAEAATAVSVTSPCIRTARSPSPTTDGAPTHVSTSSGTS